MLNAQGAFPMIGGSVFCENAVGHIDGAYDDMGGNDFGSDCDLFHDCNDNGVYDWIDIDKGDSLDVNNNGIPDECECLADITGDGIVGASDLLILLGWWGNDPQGPPDLDGDGTVGASDLLALLANWGPCP